MPRKQTPENTATKRFIAAWEHRTAPLHVSVESDYTTFLSHCIFMWKMLFSSASLVLQRINTEPEHPGFKSGAGSSSLCVKGASSVPPKDRMRNTTQIGSDQGLYHKRLLTVWFMPRLFSSVAYEWECVIPTLNKRVEGMRAKQHSLSSTHNKTTKKKKKGGINRTIVLHSQTYFHMLCQSHRTVWLHQFSFWYWGKIALAGLCFF